jgi:hypothetical protein
MRNLGVHLYNNDREIVIYEDELFFNDDSMPRDTYKLSISDLFGLLEKNKLKMIKVSD